MPAKQTILVIDNDEDLLTAVTTRLDYLGYRCVTARTGAQGLSEFDGDRVDLILTDMNMPVLDGAGVIERVRAKSDTPIIVMTAFKRDYARRLRDIPNIQFIEKPFHTHDLIDAVETELYLNTSRKAA